MAEEVNQNTSNLTINLVEDNSLELQCLVKATGICYSARCEIGRCQLLAFATNLMDIGLLYQIETSCWPIIKRIPWYRSQNKNICALCFDPTGSWLLTATMDGYIYIVPISVLIDDHRVSDNKWSTNDLTSIPILNHRSFGCRPTAIAWWQGTTQSSQIGIVGTESGKIIFINLQNGQWISSTCVDESITGLDVCRDNDLEVVTLIITSSTQRQWRLILEQRMNGCIFLFDNESNSKVCAESNTGENETSGVGAINSPNTRSRLHGLKQLSVEKLATLRQKLAETRNRNVSSVYLHGEGEGSNERGETSKLADTTKMIPQMRDSPIPEPLSEDIFLRPQYLQQGRHLFTAYCANTNRITIYDSNISIMPLYSYMVPDGSKIIILTQKLLFIVGPTRQSLSMISCPLSKVKVDEESQFNSEAMIAQFHLENTNEFIIAIHRATDFQNSSAIHVDTQTDHDKKHALKTKIDDFDIDIPLVDTCIVVTNCGVYKVVFRKPLLRLFMNLALKRNNNDIEKAARLGMIFDMNVPQLFECAGDIHLANGYFADAAFLYKLSRCRLLKGVLKTAASGHTSKLLECLNHCLAPPTASELTTTTRIHLSNLTVFAFSELILRAAPHDAGKLYESFLLFLSKNTFYDERWVVDVVGQTCLWKVLHHLSTQRGLNAQVLEVLIRTVQSYNGTSHLLPNLSKKYGLLICISEPSIIQAMLTIPLLGRSHMTFILNNLGEFQIFVLQRLVTLYDPTSPALRPLLIHYRARRRTTSHSSQSSQCDSLDSSEILEDNESYIEEFIETFLLILLTFISKSPTRLKSNPALIGKTKFPSIDTRFTATTPNVDFKRRLLACGYGHTALIRNGHVYTWGNSTQGCLGTGPTISRYGPPQPITVFRNMSIEILNVSCGRCHTLAVTNNGIYTWGGSQYGQLGLGKILQTANPELIVSLAHEIVIDAVAGQYHSVALTMDGRVFSWGWGVHGQLGHGDTLQRNVPAVVTSLLGIVIRAVAAGHAHTLALSIDGSIYAFGCNIFGQLGTGNNVKSLLPVKILLLPEPIEEIATGYFHNLAVSTTNKVYIWGSSPQVLRLQTQAQKKAKLSEFRVAVTRHAENSNDPDTNAMVTRENSDSDLHDKLSDGNPSEKVPFENSVEETSKDKKFNCSRGPSINLWGVNFGIIEETQTHLKPVLVDTSLVNGRIIQISTGCHHSTILTKDGTVYCWGRNLDGQIGNGTRRDVVIPTPLTYNPVSIIPPQVPPRSGNRALDSDPRVNEGLTRNSKENRPPDKYDQSNRLVKAVRVCCGSEFTIAIQPGGTVLSWGSNSTAQLGRLPSKELSNVAEKLVLIKSSKRVVRLPHGAHVALDTPSPVPNIPTPIITYQSYDVVPLVGRIRPLSLIEESFGELTLHYALEQFSGLYDAAKLMDKCDELGNYQAHSKLALLEQNFPIALSYQLKSLIDDNKRTSPMYASPTTVTNTVNSLLHGQMNERIKENVELFVKHVEKNLVNIIIECESKNKMKMSASRSLDSIHTIEHELHTFDCQGGLEGLCEDTKDEDIPLDITEGAIENDGNAISAVATLSQNVMADSINDDNQNSSLNNASDSSKISENEVKYLPDNLDTLISDASNIIQFYINEIDENARILCCQVLQTAFNFWIMNSLPMTQLEKICGQHIMTIFYPLGLLLFCRNETINSGVNINNDNSGAENLIITNNLSTKFCLSICRTLFNYMDQDKPILEYEESFLSTMTKHHTPLLFDCSYSRENRSWEQMMKGIISTIASKSTDPRPLLHIKDANIVSHFLESKGDTLVFTCGHYFPLSIYQSEVVPHMEAELLMTKPLSLPCTAQILGNIAKSVRKLEMMCPRCVTCTVQSATENLMVTQRLSSIYKYNE